MFHDVYLLFETEKEKYVVWEKNTEESCVRNRDFLWLHQEDEYELGGRKVIGGVDSVCLLADRSWSWTNT